MTSDGGQAASDDWDVRMEQVSAELLERWPESHVAPDLHRMTMLLELLGEPQRTIPMIHVAGTNGKTSTARIVEILLRGFGLSTGLYTSPHLARITERIRLNGDEVEPERFVLAYEELKPLIEIVDERSTAEGGPRMTMFEVLTAMAYAVFADAPVDVMVIEVGMGGRWDATNVADAQVSMIMPIGFDHTDYLGSTIEAIAFEKAGVIKPEQIVVVSEQIPGASAVIAEACEEAGARMLRESHDFRLVDREVAVGGQQLTIATPAGVYHDVFLPLFGEHQAHNAAAALTAVEAFLGGGENQLDPQTVAEASVTATSPGRLEIVRRSPTVIVDAAHNAEGARVLAAALRDSFAFSHLVGVIAVFEGKDVEGMLDEWADSFDEIIVTQNLSPRCIPAVELAESCQDVWGDVIVSPTVAEALEAAFALVDQQELPSGAGIVVTGSVVTAAEARALLVGDKESRDSYRAERSSS